MCGEWFVDFVCKLLGVFDVFSVEVCKVGCMLVGMLNFGLIGYVFVNVNVCIS